MMHEFDDVLQASRWLQQGKLLAYPTECVWGIGCDAMNEQAVTQVLQLKKRPIKKGMIVLTDSIQRIEPLLTNLNKQQRSEISNSWNINSSAIDQSTSKQLTSKQAIKKQATTWLLPIPKGILIPQWITGEHDSIAVRVINHPLIQNLCKNLISDDNPFGFLISSSCNPSGFSPAKTLSQAQAYLEEYNHVGYLKASTLNYKLPSQIKDIRTLEIIR